MTYSFLIILFYFHYFQVVGEFLWSPETQGYILGSSFLSYTIAMPFAAKLSEIFGGKIILFWSLFLASIFTLLTPFAAMWGVSAVIVVQSLRGISQVRSSEALEISFAS